MFDQAGRLVAQMTFYAFTWFDRRFYPTLVSNVALRDTPTIER